MAYNKILIKRRITGDAGAPGSLEGGELAMNEVDETLYYGSANGVIAIAGAGTFATNSLVSSLTASLDSKIDSQVSGLNTTISSVSSTLDQRITNEVAALVDSAPDLLNTLNELASALGDDENFAVTVSTNIAANSTKIDAVSAAVSDLETSADLAVAALSAELKGDISDEALARSSADTALESTVQSVSSTLDSRITEEVTALDADVIALSSAIDTEIADRIAGDSALDADVIALSSAIDTEVADRIAADSALDADVVALSSAIDTEVADRIAGDSALETTMVSVSSTLDTKIDNNYIALDTKIDSLSSSVDTEVAGLQSQINSILSNVDPAALDSLTEIVSAFQDADSNLNEAITTLANNATTNLVSVSSTLDSRITSEVQALDADVTALSAAIDAEELARTNADSALEADVTALSAAIDANSDDLKDYVHAGFLPLSGGNLTGGITVVGDVSASGTIIGASGLEIAGGSGDATLFVGGGMVGIGTETPNEELTVVGSISASESMFASDATFSGNVTVAAPTLDGHAATKLYVDTKVSDLVAGAPVLLDTLNELAAAIGDDENFAATVATNIGANTTLINTVSGDLAQEIADRGQAISTIDSKIDTQISSLSSTVDANFVEKTESDAVTLNGGLTVTTDMFVDVATATFTGDLSGNGSSILFGFVFDGGSF